MYLRNLVLSFVMTCLIVPPLPATNSDLPDIGSPGDSVLSRDRELQIGRGIYRSLIDTDFYNPGVCSGHRAETGRPGT